MPGSMQNTNMKSIRGSMTDLHSTELTPARCPLLPTEYASIESISPFIPACDPENKNGKGKFKAWCSGRGAVLTTACIVGIITFAANLTITLVLRSKFSQQGLAGSDRDPYLYRGDCKNASTLGSVLHILINIISTTLLSASNLCMQLLLAPTRAQIDKAHKAHRWLDVGVNSLHNFRSVAVSRQAVWVILALSSLPLHFVYNSAVYNTEPLNQSFILVVTPQFLAGNIGDRNEAIKKATQRGNQTIVAMNQHTRKIELTQLNPISRLSFMIPYSASFESICSYNESCLGPYQWLVNNEFSHNRSAIDCLKRYSDGFGNRSSALMVSTYDLLDNATIESSANPLLFSRIIGLWDNMRLWRPHWLCGYSNTFDCRRKTEFSDPEVTKNWNIFGYKVDYCLSQEISRENRCSVRFSLPTLTAVTIANALKLLGIIYTVCIYYDANGDSKPIVTLGDAIESFLHESDGETGNRCLQDKAALLGKNATFWAKDQSPKIFQQNKGRWHAVISVRRWFWTLIPCIILVLAGIGTFVYSLNVIAARTQNTEFIFQGGWSKVNEFNIGLLSLDIAKFSHRELRVIITAFANMWQWAVSLIYMQSNALMTCLCMEAEWQSYATRKKALRVSVPRGLQRSSYFVSLPARYGLTMMAVFALLHWTLSQSLSLLVVESIWIDGTITSDMPFLASNSWPIITSIAICCVFMVSLILVSFKRMSYNLPPGATCSAIISAACHAPQEDKDASLFPVQWGEVHCEAFLAIKNTKVLAPVITSTNATATPALEERQAVGLDAILPASPVLTNLYPVDPILPVNESLDDTPVSVLALDPEAPDMETRGSSQSTECISSEDCRPTQKHQADSTIYHCCFTTSASIQRPTEGRLYR